MIAENKALLKSNGHVRSDTSLFQVSGTTKKTDHGVWQVYSGTQQDFNSCQDTTVSWPLAIKRHQRRYQLNKSVLRCLISHFEEIYGLSVDCDVFGDDNYSLLPLYGRSDVVGDTTLLIFTDPTLLSEIVIFLKKVKTIALLITPDWVSHDWHRHLMENATHRFILPIGSVSLEWFEGGSSSCFFWDSRYEARASPLTSTKIPSVDILACKVWPPRQRLSTCNFSLPITKTHLQVGWFLKWGKALPSEMLTVHKGYCLWLPHLL